MSREWKPGDVAMVATDIIEGTLSSWATNCPPGTNHPDAPHWHVLDSGRFIAADANGFTARPLVVIDPEDAEQVERLVRSLPLEWNLEQVDDPDLFHESVDYVRAALRSLIATPKPDEPMGLGAVVEDADGLRYVRTGDGDCPRPWALASIPSFDDWRDVSVVRVLSEGVQP